MKYIFVKLNDKSSLYKALKQRELIDYRGYIPLVLSFVPRIGESFVLPYGALNGNLDNDKLEQYLNNRNNHTPVLKVKDLITEEASRGHLLYYLECDYVIDTDNWL